mgnify:CR=1 FL=1
MQEKRLLEIIESNSYNYDELKLFRDKYVETHKENNTENVCNIINEYL